jgi:predicted enzyme related to lactoylglutathione lyase
MFYIQVPDLEVALDSVTKGGGAVVLPPTNVAPEVFIATFSDPAGNVVGLTRAPVRDA